MTSTHSGNPYAVHESRVPFTLETGSILDVVGQWTRGVVTKRIDEMLEKLHGRQVWARPTSHMVNSSILVGTVVTIERGKVNGEHDNGCLTASVLVNSVWVDDRRGNVGVDWDPWRCMWVKKNILGEPFLKIFQLTGIGMDNKIRIPDCFVNDTTFEGCMFCSNTPYHESREVHLDLSIDIDRLKRERDTLKSKNLKLELENTSHETCIKRLENTIQCHKEEQKVTENEFESEMLKLKKQTKVRECCICMELPADHIITPCGHACLCHLCAEMYGPHKEHHRCPLCRETLNVGPCQIFYASPLPVSYGNISAFCR